MLWHLSSECQVSQITYKKVVTHLLQISLDPKCGHSRCDTESEGHSSVDISLIAGPGLMATLMEVTGLWFSRDAMVRPLDRVETFRGSALISSLSGLATACAWAANVLLAAA